MYSFSVHTTLNIIIMSLISVACSSVYEKNSQMTKTHYDLSIEMQAIMHENSFLINKSIADVFVVYPKRI